MNSLGKYLKEIREEHRLNLEDAALFLNVDKSYLKLIENDEIIPNETIILRFKNFYSISDDEIVKHFNNSPSSDLKSNYKNNIRSSYLIIKYSIVLLTLLLVTIGYVLLGQYTCRGYEIYWTLFFLPFIVNSFIRSIYFHQFTRFPIIFITLMIYLTLGMYGALWHPYWAILIAIPLYYLIFIPIDLHLSNCKIN